MYKLVSWFKLCSNIFLPCIVYILAEKLNWVVKFPIIKINILMCIFLTLNLIFYCTSRNEMWLKVKKTPHKNIYRNNIFTALILISISFFMGMQKATYIFFAALSNTIIVVYYFFVINMYACIKILKH